MTADALLLPPQHVVAGALIDTAGRVLIAARPPGKSFAGRWEFPGGKVNDGEAPRAALVRELAEELGIDVGRAEPLLAVSYRYPGSAAAVLIECWRVESWRGQVESRDQQQLRWCTRAELADVDMLEADRPIITALLMPRRIVRVAATESLPERVSTVPGRERTAWLVHEPPADPGLVRRLVDQGDLVFVIDPREPPAAGVGSVYTAAAHPTVQARPTRALAGRVVHSGAEALSASALGAEFLLVPERRLAPAEISAIAAVGLPWYLDSEAPVPDAAPPTGTLWWDATVPTGRR
jgi:8-oxo-dGTP diphosphatase